MIRLLRTRPYAFALVLFALLLIANIAAQPSFASPSNWAETLAIFAPFAIAALASTPAIMSGGGGIDISIGPLMTVIDMMHPWPSCCPMGLSSPWVVVPFCLVMGAAVGAINGTLVTVLRFQPVVATLCMNFILTGLATQIEGSSTPQGSTWWTNDLASSFGPVPGGLISIAVPLLHDFKPAGSRPRAEKSKELVRAKIMRMASIKKALPTCVIKRALNPARKLRSFWRKEISAHEHNVVISQKTRN